MRILRGCQGGAQENPREEIRHREAARPARRIPRSMGSKMGEWPQNSDADIMDAAAPFDQTMEKAVSGLPVSEMFPEQRFNERNRKYLKAVLPIFLEEDQE